MAKFEKTIQGDFAELLKRIEAGILEGNMSASLEENSDFHVGNSRCSVRVFERAWDGTEESAQHNENERYSYANLDYEIWKAFVEYEDPDGYFFYRKAGGLMRQRSLHGLIIRQNPLRFYCISRNRTYL